jgi:hypothetical protein
MMPLLLGFQFAADNRPSDFESLDTFYCTLTLCNLLAYQDVSTSTDRLKTWLTVPSVLVRIFPITSHEHGLTNLRRVHRSYLFPE